MHAAESRANDALLDLVDVGVDFRSPGSQAPLTVLSGISLAVDPGDFVVVAGRSGSGKTTLLNVAAALVPPRSGLVMWDGMDVGRLSRDDQVRLRARFIGYVFQDAGLIDSLTAAENVALGAVATGSKPDRRRALRLLDDLGLRSRADHFPAQLSGGEKQRVALARALYASPPLLLVDEPTANLDRQSGDNLIALLEDVRSDGRGLLVAGHDPHLLKAATRVVPLTA